MKSQVQTSLMKDAGRSAGVPPAQPGANSPHSKTLSSARGVAPLFYGKRGRDARAPTRSCWCERWLRSNRLNGAFPFVLASLLLCLAVKSSGHESPVDHVERELRLWVDGGRLHLSYRVQQSERAVLLQLQRMDTNGDGVISDVERDAFFTAQAARLTGLFTLEVDGQVLRFAPASGGQRDARLGQTFIFTAPLAALRPGRHTGRLVDGYSRLYPGPFRWVNDGNQRGIRVEPVAQPEDHRMPLHPASLALKFEVVVPE